jgi:hypothetical protein
MFENKKNNYSTFLYPNLPKEDYYIEDGLIVFTEAYHLKKGKCCNSGCRHCPWNFKRKTN